MKLKDLLVLVPDGQQIMITNDDPTDWAGALYTGTNVELFELEYSDEDGMRMAWRDLMSYEVKNISAETMVDADKSKHISVETVVKEDLSLYTTLIIEVE